MKGNLKGEEGVACGWMDTGHPEISFKKTSKPYLLTETLAPIHKSNPRNMCHDELLHPCKPGC